MSGINSIYDSYSNAPVNSKSASKVKEPKAENAAKSSEAAASEKAAEKRTDSFERTVKANANTYTKGIKTEYAGKTALNIKNEGMKDMVAQLLGQATNAAAGKDGKGLTLESIMKSFDLDYIESDGSEDFWGAEKTANRILDFAKSLAGNDEKAFQKVKAAFEKGFGECEKIWGGKLPGVCYDTVDNVRKGFDEWEKEFNTQADAAATAATD
jgi:hypothetical protein